MNTLLVASSVVASIALAFSSKNRTAEPTPTPTYIPVATATVSPGHVPADWDYKPSGNKWTEYTIKSLEYYGASLYASKPKDEAEFCPGFSKKTKDEKTKSLVMLISSMARFESSHNPGATYRESFDDANGNPVISRGLLQLSIESGNLYGCGLKKAEDLHDAETNIRCAVRILSRWVERDVYFGSYDSGHKGGGRYWSVLRRNSDARQKIIKKMKESCQ